MTVPQNSPEGFAPSILGVGEASTERLLRIIETMPNAFLSLDLEYRISYINAEGERLIRAPRHELVGRKLLDAFPEAAGTEFEIQYRHALETGQPVMFEEYYPPLESWFEVHAWPDLAGLNVSFSNINERRTVELQRAVALDQAVQANARLSFLSELSSQLGGVTLASEVFERLSRSVTHNMGDWCTIVVPVGEELVRVEAAHRDPTLDGLAKRLVGAYPHSFSGPSPGVVVYRSGEPLRLARLAQQIVADLDDSVASTAYGRTLMLLGDGPGLIMPIKSRGEVEAVLTTVRSDGEPFSDDDVAVMYEVTARVSMALDDARHIQTQRETAGALQAAALPRSLPTVENVELAAGYRAASEGSQVGGDWYDAFELPSGRLALVVGDAAGHGLEAAAVMAQMRNALRAQLFASLSPPESLNSLSILLGTHEPESLATIVCVVLDPRTGEATWTSAGHPAPILVSGDLSSAAYLRGEPAPPIGMIHVQAGTPVVEHTVTLTSGDRLVLFSDGLIERRGTNLEIGLTHLMILAEQTRGAYAAAACDTILQGILARVHEDDVCLLIADFKRSAVG